MGIRKRGWLAALILGWFASTGTMADTAPDPTGTGPYATATGSYQFAPAVMPDVMSDRATELWAQVYYPTGSLPATLPVVMVLHGNHATCGRGSNPRVDDSCQYTTSGTCPAGYVVTPNHLGYAYFAQKLASWGYFVVSINANRGITCGSGVTGDSGLNLARGRLVLKHLQKIGRWATGSEVPPVSLGFAALSQLDFSRVGLAGHSRGGEGVRAAYAQYLDPGSVWPAAIPLPVGFAGIFEIGAVDGQTSRVLDAKGVPWHQVLPMCDGDVYDLQGIKPYDRMWNDFTEKPVAPKSTYAVWGANHNYFNTEWQTSDSSGCVGHTAIFNPALSGSTGQQTIGLTAAAAFFRSHLAGTPPDTALLGNFDPLFDLPLVATSVTRVERNFMLSPNSSTSPPLEDFSAATGTSLKGFKNRALGVTVTHGTVPQEDLSYRGARISWTQAGRRVLFQNTWAARGAGLDLSGHDSLDLRISRSTSTLNPGSQVATDLTVALVDASGRVGKVRLSAYHSLVGPVGTSLLKHQILQTVRIPLADFAGVDLTRVNSARLIFDQTASGEIYLSGLRAGRFSEPTAPVAVPPAMVATGVDAAGADTVERHTGAVLAVRQARATSALRGRDGMEIELVLDGDRRFPVRGALAVLEVGAQRFTVSRHPDDGDTSRLIFTVPAADYQRLATGDAVRVWYGSAASDRSNWEARFGTLTR